MIEWLKWLVAGRELAELERWRVQCRMAEQWLAEFPAAASALDYLHRAVTVGDVEIAGHREAMRRERRIRGELVAPAVFGCQPAPVLSGTLVPGGKPVLLTMPDGTKGIVFHLQPDPDLPAGYGDVIEPASGRVLAPAERDGVAYRFLSAECGD